MSLIYIKILLYVLIQVFLNNYGTEHIREIMNHNNKIQHNGPSQIEASPKLKLLFADLFSRAVYYNKQEEVNKLVEIMRTSCDNYWSFDKISAELNEYCDLLTLPCVPFSILSDIIDNLGEQQHPDGVS